MSRIIGKVHKSGGVVRSAQLVREGHSRHYLAELVTAGRLVRIRRSWVALPAAAPDLLFAARAGVVISCVSAAQRLGLWVLDASHMHVGVRSTAGHLDLPRGTVAHWRYPLIPRNPADLIDPIENALALVAQCQPFEAALAVWESALQKQLVDPLVLQRLPLPARAHEILQRANPFAESGLETFVIPRLRWLRLRIIPQVWIAGHRVDFLIGECLVLQTDGGTHVGAQRELDNRHDALLNLMGYHVIRVGYHQVVSDWASVQDAILRAVAQGLHRSTSC
jgi:very-short-patch-repair endonuclease